MNKIRPDGAPLILKDADTKLNVVEGVLQNYLDQLLVTATEQPQKIEKTIEIPVQEEVKVAPIEIAPVEIAPAVEIPEIVIERKISKSNIIFEKLIEFRSCFCAFKCGIFTA